MVRAQSRHIRAVIAAGFCAAALSACGSSPATKQDVIARANAICASTLRAIRATAPSGGAGSASALSGYLDRVVPILETEVTSLRALPRPAMDRALLNRFVAAITTTGRQYRALAVAARRNDQAAVSQVLAGLRSSSGPALARRYGLTQCASAVGTSVA